MESQIGFAVESVVQLYRKVLGQCGSASPLVNRSESRVQMI